MQEVVSAMATASSFATLGLLSVALGYVFGWKGQVAAFAVFALPIPLGAVVYHGGMVTAQGGLLIGGGIVVGVLGAALAGFGKSLRIRREAA
ncbi:MAG: hypothetical protein R6U99_13865 [Nioella sp.]